uniref:EamA domain-containing protein n=1 Tax=Florenciella sp. virus SA2 TaxID=3240092 RepID=A0AB39JCD6_9VIRU
MNPCYIYAIVSCIIIGFHIFSLKYLDISIKTHKNKNNKYFILLFIIITAIISRFFIYKSMQTAPHPAFVHIILNFSIFIVLLLSIIILKKKVDLLKFIIGLLLCISGFIIVKKSLY